MGNKLGDKVKLVVYSGADNKTREYFRNFLSEQHLKPEIIVANMTKRLLVEKKRNLYSVAIFYLNNVEYRRLHGIKI